MHPFLKLLACVYLSLCAFALQPDLAQAGPPTPERRLLPESERSLSACLVGVEAENAQYFMLPILADPSRPLPAFDQVREQMFWLNLELSHGQLLRDLSPSAQLYVALSGSSAEGSRRRDEDWFRGYLRERCAWSGSDLAGRLHFYGVPDTMIWTQDATVELGEDGHGRRILALDESAREDYKGLVKALAASYPERFVLHPLPNDVSAEGGDLAVVRRPDDSVGLVIGRHRVLDWLRRKGLGDYLNRAVPDGLIRQASAAYAKAYGLPVQVLPVDPLRRGWGSEDLFHLDMLAGFLAVSGRAMVVVPAMQARSRDSLTNQVFSAEQTADWKREFDQVALELRQAGYKVARVPLGDNPVRSPANSVRFDPGDGGPVQVLLSRYPDQSPGMAPSISALRYQESLAQFRQAGDRWNEAPDAQHLPALGAALQRVWQGLDRCRTLGNAVADAQAVAYASLGCRVHSVDDYPWGAGGFHCQFLH